MATRGQDNGKPRCPLRFSAGYGGEVLPTTQQRSQNLENAIYIYIDAYISVCVFGDNDAYVMGMITGLTHNYRDSVDRDLDNS